MKIVSPSLSHKTEVGGVRLGVKAEQVAEMHDEICATVALQCPDAKIQGVLIEPMAEPGGLEVLVGISRDSVFGYVMTFGLGGIHVELFRDVTRRILPVTLDMAREMTSELRSAALLSGHRGAQPRDIEALHAQMVALSDYVIAKGDCVEEIDLNPVWVGTMGQGAMALDAVVVERI